jgi:DNA invertase Pin-like site-specific DNA recombinase
VKRLETVDDGGSGLRVLNLGDTKTATGKLILTIFAGFAQFEREMMLERRREGIAKAKAENRHLGRRPSARLKADEAVKFFNAGTHGDANRERPWYRTGECLEGA